MDCSRCCGEETTPTSAITLAVCQHSSLHFEVVPSSFFLPLILSLFLSFAFFFFFFFTPIFRTYNQTVHEYLWWKSLILTNNHSDPVGRKTLHLHSLALDNCCTEGGHSMHAHSIRLNLNASSGRFLPSPSHFLYPQINLHQSVFT